MAAVLSLFGTLIVVVLTAWFNTRTLIAQIDGLGAEVKQSIAELDLRLTKQLTELVRLVERLEEAHGLSRP